MNDKSLKYKNADAVGKEVWVSIIIPCYNHEKFIQRTLDSILADTYPFKEIVILNDGSKDNSDEKIREWISVHGHEINITYTSRENKGITISMNELTRQAKGKYILPIASDDCLYGNTIARRVNILENEPQKTVLLNDAYVIDADDNIVMQSSATDYWKADKKKYMNDKDLIYECIRGPKIGGPIIMYNRSILDEIGMHPEHLEIEDWYFYQRAACLKRMVYIDFKVALYRVHGDNFSGASMKHALKIVTYILKVLRINFWIYPGLKFKLFAIKTYFVFLAWYIKVKLKIK
jgi:alpha-1,3-rhamnosyltransferase